MLSFATATPERLYTQPSVAHLSLLAIRNPCRTACILIQSVAHLSLLAIRNQ